MMRSMFSGVSGLRVHQTMMDVIGNNISNLNTVGFKSSSMTFQSMLSQTLKGASGSVGEQGGTNPIQVGLGSQMGSVDVNFSQGNLQSTGNVTDMAIEGEGFFILGSNAGKFYTRAGNFSFDSEGYLVNPSNGSIVQGWVADENGNINTSNAIGNIQIPIDMIVEPRATTNIEYSGNLRADADIGSKYMTSIDVIDSQGNRHDISIEFIKSDSNEWSWEVQLPNDATGNGTIDFDADGIISAISGNTITYNPDGSQPMSINIDFGEVGKMNGITQFSTTSDIAAVSQNGNGPGSLQSLSIGGNGQITGIFSNGQNRNLGQIAIAMFKNPSGLLNYGNSLYGESNNSGIPIIGESSSGGRGDIVSGNLEMSNVDLAKEFANMIISQRGFQANSKIITVSDEMLMDLVRLK